MFLGIIIFTFLFSHLGPAMEDAEGPVEKQLEKMQAILHSEIFANRCNEIRLDKLGIICKLCREIILKKTQLEELENPQPEVWCKQRIFGDDWCVLQSRVVVLQAQTPFFIPSDKWRRLNCKISWTKKSEQGIIVKISPNLFPILGEFDPDYTWEAEVWLESHPLKTDEGTLKVAREELAIKNREFDNFIAYCCQSSGSSLLVDQGFNSCSLPTQ